jgi:hypothetical protein
LFFVFIASCLLTIAGLTPDHLSYHRYGAYVIELLILHDPTDQRMLDYCHNVIWQNGPPFDDVTEAKRYKTVAVLQHKSEVDAIPSFLRPSYPQLICMGLKLYRQDMTGALKMAMAILSHNDLYSVHEQNMVLVMIAIALIRHNADLSLLINDLPDPYWLHTLLQWSQTVLPKETNRDMMILCQQMALRILPKLASGPALCRVPHWREMVPCNPWDANASRIFLYQQQLSHDAIRIALDAILPGGGEDKFGLLDHYSPEVRQRWRQALDERYDELQNEQMGDENENDDQSDSAVEEEAENDMRVEPNDRTVEDNNGQVMMPIAQAAAAQVNVDENDDEEEESFHDAQLPSSDSEDDQSSSRAATPERSVQGEAEQVNAAGASSSEPESVTDASDVQHLVNDDDDDDVTAGSAIAFSDDDVDDEAAVDDQPGFAQQGFAQQGFGQDADRQFLPNVRQEYDPEFNHESDREESGQESGQEVEYSTNSDVARSVQQQQPDQGEDDDVEAVVDDSSSSFSTGGTETDDDDDDDDPMETDMPSPQAVANNPQPLLQQANKELGFDAGKSQAEDEDLKLEPPDSNATSTDDDYADDDDDEVESDDEEPGRAQSETATRAEGLEGKLGSDENEERDMAEEAGYFGEESQLDDDDDEVEPPAPSDIGHDHSVVPDKESAPAVPLAPPGRNVPVDRGYEAEHSQDDAYVRAAQVVRSGYEPEDSQNTATEEDTEDDQESQVELQVESNVAVSEVNSLPPARAPDFPAHSLSDMDQADEQTVAGLGAESSELDEDMNDGQPLDSPTVAFESKGGTLTDIAGQVQAHESATKQALASDNVLTKVQDQSESITGVQPCNENKDMTDESIGADGVVNTASRTAALSAVDNADASTNVVDDKFNEVDSAKDGDDHDGVAVPSNNSNAENETTGVVLARTEHNEAMEYDKDSNETAEPDDEESTFMDVATTATLESIAIAPAPAVAATKVQQVEAIVEAEDIYAKDGDDHDGVAVPSNDSTAANETTGGPLASTEQKESMEYDEDSVKMAEPDGEESTLMHVETTETLASIAITPVPAVAATKRKRVEAIAEAEDNAKDGGDHDGVAVPSNDSSAAHETTGGALASTEQKESMEYDEVKMAEPDGEESTLMHVEATATTAKIEITPALAVATSNEEPVETMARAENAAIEADTALDEIAETKPNVEAKAVEAIEQMVAEKTGAQTTSEQQVESTVEAEKTVDAEYALDAATGTEPEVDPTTVAVEPTEETAPDPTGAHTRPGVVKSSAAQVEMIVQSEAERVAGGEAENEAGTVDETRYSDVLAGDYKAGPDEAIAVKHGVDEQSRPGAAMASETVIVETIVVGTFVVAETDMVTGTVVEVRHADTLVRDDVDRTADDKSIAERGVNEGTSEDFAKDDEMVQVGDLGVQCNTELPGETNLEEETEFDGEDVDPSEATSAHMLPQSQESTKDVNDNLDEGKISSFDEGHEMKGDDQVEAAAVVAQEDVVPDDKPKRNDDSETVALVDHSANHPSEEFANRLPEDEYDDVGQEPRPDPSLLRLKKALGTIAPLPDPAAVRLLRSKGKGGNVKKEELESAAPETMYVEPSNNLRCLNKITTVYRTRPLEKKKINQDLKNSLGRDNVLTSGKRSNARLVEGNKKPKSLWRRKRSLRQSVHVPLIAREAAY